MELTPQLLTDEIDFRIAVRGYDRHEVDDFLERVAVAVGQLQSQLTKAVERARTAEEKLSEPTAGAPTPVEEPVSETDEPAPSGPGAPPPAAPVAPEPDDVDLDDELRRTLVLAQRTADMAIREAREEAGQIREEAEQEARRVLAEASEESARAREEARGRLIEEIRELEQTRETMRSDTEVLERYLGTERARVRETIQVLRRLVDEPERFRPSDPPELSAVSLPRELSAAPEVGQEVPEEDAPGRAGVTEEPTTEATGSDPADTDPVEAPTADVAVDEPPVDEPPVEADADTAGEESGPEDAEAVDSDARRTVEPATGDAEDSERLGQLFDSGDGPRDWRSSGPDRGDQGPHTQPVAAARFEEESDEAFLAELRAAMSEDEPLGPDEKD